MKVPSTDILAVGIDPAKRSHHGVALVYPEVKLISKKIENNYQAIMEFDRIVEKIAKEKGLHLIYGLEDSGAYGKPLKEFLLEKERMVLEVNPLKTNRQKDFYGQDKSDQIDARCVASIVLRSHDELPSLTKSIFVYETIKEAERFREILVKTKTQNVNRLHFYLTRTWMCAYKDFATNLLSNYALEFFVTYPIPEMLKEVEVDKIAELLHSASCGRGGNPKKAKKPREYSRQKAESILEAVKPIKNRPITPEKEIEAEIIRQLALGLKGIKKSILAIDKKLKKLISQTGQAITSFKGIDTATASVILGEFQNPDRFQTRHEFATFNGTAPRLDSTGGKVKHVSNKRCNRRLKRTFYQIALTASRCDPISKAFYQGCISRGLSKEEALKRLARRISDIVFAMIKTQSPYSKEKALENMRRRKSPYLPKENEGEMAISVDEISFESLLEIDEPCLTLADYFNLSEEKRQEKIARLLKNRAPAEAPSIQKRASKSFQEPRYWARHRHYYV